MDWYVNESWDKMREMGFGNELAGFGSGSYPTIWGEPNTSPVAQKFGSMTSKYARIWGINKSVMAPVIGPEFDTAKAWFRAGIRKPLDFLFPNAMKFLDQGMPFTGWRDVGMGAGKEIYNQVVSIAELAIIPTISPELSMTSLLGGKSSLGLPRMDISGGELSGAAAVEVAEVLPIARIATTVGKVGIFAKGGAAIEAGAARKVPGVLGKAKGVSFWGRTAIRTESVSLTPMQELNEALQQSRIYEQLDKIPASSANAARALNRKLSVLQDFQNNANKVEILSNGSVRYYAKFRQAKTSGPTIGSRFVVEYNPTTSEVDLWNETYDSLDNVNMIHLKNINGIQIDVPHFPSILSDLLGSQFTPKPKF